MDNDTKLDELFINLIDLSNELKKACERPNFYAMERITKDIKKKLRESKKYLSDKINGTDSIAE